MNIRREFQYYEGDFPDTLIELRDFIDIQLLSIPEEDWKIADIEVWRTHGCQNYCKISCMREPTALEEAEEAKQEGFRIVEYRRRELDTLKRLKAKYEGKQ